MVIGSVGEIATVTHVDIATDIVEGSPGVEYNDSLLGRIEDVSAVGEAKTSEEDEVDCDDECDEETSEHPDFLLHRHDDGEDELNEK